MKNSCIMVNFYKHGYQSFFFSKLVQIHPHRKYLHKIIENRIIEKERTRINV